MRPRLASLVFTLIVVLAVGALAWGATRGTSTGSGIGSAKNQAAARTTLQTGLTALRRSRPRSHLHRVRRRRRRVLHRNHQPRHDLGCPRDRRALGGREPPGRMFSGRQRRWYRPEVHVPSQGTVARHLRGLPARRGMVVPREPDATNRGRGKCRKERPNEPDPCARRAWYHNRRDRLAARNVGPRAAAVRRRDYVVRAVCLLHRHRRRRARRPRRRYSRRPRRCLRAVRARSPSTSASTQLSSAASSQLSALALSKGFRLDGKPCIAGSTPASCGIWGERISAGVQELFVATLTDDGRGDTTGTLAVTDQKVTVQRS